LISRLRRMKTRLTDNSEPCKQIRGSLESWESSNKMKEQRKGIGQTLDDLIEPV